jgi:hypothetical protein
VHGIQRTRGYFASGGVHDSLLDHERDDAAAVAALTHHRVCVRVCGVHVRVVLVP